MPSQSELQASVEYNYRFQKGMYLDGRKIISGATIYYSNHIEDIYWNYAIDIKTTEENTSAVITGIEEATSAMDRSPAFYVTPWTEPHGSFVEAIRARGYQRQFQDAWMFYEGGTKSATPGANAPNLTIKRVDQPSEVDDFVNVFDKVYRGEPTEDEPYANLPPTYLTALRQSFALRDVDTFHLIGYRDGQPISIATLVYADGWGGIYNVGTLPAHRHQGLGALISLACIEKWHENGGRTLFLQTEVGSKNEEFYSRLSFKTAFIGECWAK